MDPLMKVNLQEEEEEVDEGKRNATMERFVRVMKEVGERMVVKDQAKVVQRRKEEGKGFERRKKVKIRKRQKLSVRRERKRRRKNRDWRSYRRSSRVRLNRKHSSIAIAVLAKMKERRR